MAELLPFRGWRYASTRQAQLHRLIAPPYDVITPRHRERLAAADKQAFVHLILPEGGAESRYENAAQRLAAWRQQGVMVQDETATYTIHRQRYTHIDGGQRTRTGLLGLLPLPARDDGSILPHENTMEGPRTDRRRLMEATHAHLSPIFLLAHDEQGELDALLEQEAEGLAFEDPEGIGHRVEVIHEGARQRALQQALRNTTLVIADGHHRYESAQACRQRLAAACGEQSALVHGAGKVLAHVVSMASPGLTVVAFHRLVRSLPMPAHAFVDQLARQHPLKSFPVRPPAEALRQWQEAPAGTIGIVCHGDDRLHTVNLSPTLPSEDPVGQLEVSLLHDEILQRQLNLSPEDVEDGKVEFLKDPGDVLSQVADGSFQAGFLVRPPSMEELMAVTRAGRRMPQKSTNFYPKVPAGIVFHGFDG